MTTQIKSMCQPINELISQAKVTVYDDDPDMVAFVGSTGLMTVSPNTFKTLAAYLKTRRHTFCQARRNDGLQMFEYSWEDNGVKFTFRHLATDTTLVQFSYFVETTV